MDILFVLLYSIICIFLVTFSENSAIFFYFRGYYFSFEVVHITFSEVSRNKASFHLQSFDSHFTLKAHNAVHREGLH